MYASVLKRWFDVVGAGVLLTVCSPVLLLIAFAIGLEDGRPVIFRQSRIGRDGKPFTLYKFRSMPVGTQQVPSAQALHVRLTRVGRVIRRTNVDELPQLLNILRGDMSLIGPRPALPSQASLLAARNARGIMTLRPGLTGLAQVNAYDGMSEQEKIAWEARYLQNVSLALDMVILTRTFAYLLRRPPVY